MRARLCAGLRPDARRVCGRVTNSPDAGMGLVEVLVALLLITTVLLAVAGTATSGLRSMQDSQLRQRGSVAASRAIEAARSQAYDSLAMRTGDAVVTAAGGSYDPDGSGGLGSETVIAAAGGLVSGDPYQVSNDAGLTLATYVTWYDDPDITGTQNAKRVTSVVMYAIGSNPKVFRHSTLIANAYRGQAAVSFTMTPVTVSLDVPPSTTRCAAHVITNTGSADRHDVVVPANVTSSSWSLQMYEDSNNDAVYNAGDALLVDSTGDGIPETSSQLAKNGTRRIFFCYSPQSGALPQIVVAPVLRSSYDSSVRVTLAQTVNMTNFTTRLYLHDPGNNATAATSALPAFALNTTAPNAVTRAVLPNYDTAARDADALPGRALVKGSTSYRALFDYQIPANMTLAGSATLEIWVSWRDALLTGSTTATNVRPEITVTRRNSANSAVLSTLRATYIYNHVHAAAGWVKLTIPLTLTSATFAGNEYLRLQVGCASTSTGTCHIAYDSVDHPSTFTVQSP